MPFSDRPVLVTGAGGFIGGRVVEVLHRVPGISVRASVRQWGSAVRIGRLPVEIVLCDVTQPAQVRKAVEGTRAVIHCAYGDPHASVDGTRNVLEAALEAGTGRVVHLSTMEVYGDVEGEVREDAPLRKTGWPYRDSKIAAELLCRTYMDRGLPVSILRPTIVYGPFSQDWTVRLAERLVSGGTFPSRDDCQGGCNLLYVDDLVAAIMLALEREEAVGEAFNVNGEERLTWWRYLNALSRAMDLPPLDRGHRLARRARSAALAPVRTAARMMLGRFRHPIMALYQTSPVAQRLMRKVEGVIRRTPAPQEYRLFGRNVFLPVDKARERLGYRSRFPVSRGVSLSASWLRHHGFVGVPEQVLRGAA
jgi:nucleoside-diphosphate-sugar epimerase